MKDHWETNLSCTTINQEAILKLFVNEPSDLFDIPKKRQRLIIQKNKRRLRRINKRLRRANNDT